MSNNKTKKKNNKKVLKLEEIFTNEFIKNIDSHNETTKNRNHLVAPCTRDKSDNQKFSFYYDNDVRKVMFRLKNEKKIHSVQRFINNAIRYYLNNDPYFASEENESDEK